MKRKKKTYDSMYRVVGEAKGINDPFTIDLCPFCKELTNKKYVYCMYCGKKIKGIKLLKETIR